MHTSTASSRAVVTSKRPKSCSSCSRNRALDLLTAIYPVGEVRSAPVPPSFCDHVPLDPSGVLARDPASSKACGIVIDVANIFKASDSLRLGRCGAGVVPARLQANTQTLAQVTGQASSPLQPHGLHHCCLRAVVVVGINSALAAGLQNAQHPLGALAGAGEPMPGLSQDGSRAPIDGNALLTQQELADKHSECPSDFLGSDVVRIDP